MKDTDRIFVIHQKPGPRHFYIAGFLSDSLGINFIMTPEITDPGPRIIYGDAPEIDGIHIPESGLLSEESIRPFMPVVEKQKNVLLFPATENYDLPFDIFSAIFYFLSRYEEYLPFEADTYGRFELKQSFAYKKGFHQEPVVDQWLITLSELIQKRYPELNIPQRQFRFISTFDIDRPWAFKHRRMGRNIQGLAKDLVLGRFNTLFQKLQVITNRADDPFDVYSFIHRIEDQFQFKSVFFFLLADKKRIDSNHSLHSDAFRNLICDVSGDHQVGIHPSFHSNNDNEKLKEEIHRFHTFTGQAPEISRQHYLLLRFPDTCQRLIQLGIKDDYSMGYATGIGFRAGTTLPFRFYDLQVEKQTSLTVHPFAVMDVTLMQYMNMDAGQAIMFISELIKKIKQVNGVFVSLWHNESLSEWENWKGWRSVFVEMVKRAVY